MKISRRQLRQIIKEELSRVIQETHSLERVDYERWASEAGHITPAASSVMATYFLDQGLEDDLDLQKKLAAEFYMDHQDVMRDMERQRRDVMSGEELAAVGADYDEAGDLIDLDDDGALDADELRAIADDLEGESEKPLRLRAPTRSPWQLKAELGLGQGTGPYDKHGKRKRGWRHPLLGDTKK